MGTIEGWQTRRRTKAQQEEFIIAKAHNHGCAEGYKKGVADERARIGTEIETLRAVAVTAERLCKYDGSKSMTAKGRYYDAQKAMEYSDRLHELLAEWRKGQKESRW